MNLRRLSWVVSAVFMLALAASAQKGKLEISPAVGWETSGSFPVVNTTNPNIDQLRLDSSLSYGASIDYSVTQSLALEALWVRNQSTYSQHDFTTGFYSPVFDSNVDQVEFGVLYELRRGGLYGDENKLQPFIAGGLGFTHEDNSQGTPNRTSFAFNLGGGVKYYVSKHFGLRGDIRYMPTYANTTNALACSPFFGDCFVVRQHKFQQRGNFSGGIILRF
ncbi:MAG: outer membrane beta-barrel protein [Candidatus Korobacteraceae bacterium]